jgi:hypothetical protein
MESVHVEHDTPVARFVNQRLSWSQKPAWKVPQAGLPLVKYELVLDVSWHGARTVDTCSLDRDVLGRYVGRIERRKRIIPDVPSFREPEDDVVVLGHAGAGAEFTSSELCIEFT